ncbi:MAG: hypothetical protein LM558_02600 [Thermosphaera sp.]|nr:hypothetical protein [Thermosphaera sp.]
MEEIHVRKYGEKMNSPKATNRMLYLEIQPFDSISSTIGAVHNLDLLWELDSPNLEPWYKYQLCNYCIRRAKYELEKFSKGEWVWNRRWCMRHYLIEHLGEISTYSDVIQSNRLVDLYISRSQIRLITGSNNYKYYITINRPFAVLAVEYKGRRYIFKYSNHANALPFASSYLTLLFEVRYNIVGQLLSFLEEVERVREKIECTPIANIYINGNLILPACTE